jgi:hypothetical protein
MSLAIQRSEVLSHLHVVNMNRRFRSDIISKMQFRIAAPRQKLRIALNAINQHKHFFSRVRHEDGFHNFSHSGRTEFRESAC